ncbi:hypothetical protein [Cryptosporangium minutisporangium]|uniref:Uncharacterized protein n=1 Tax=Cryptosporangium minutisporangium TaxID=113569 RepID=A0ABP6SV46_9ACTN
MTGTPPAGPGELDLDEIVRLICLADVPAFVGQSGGGTATIYAGHPYIDEHGDERMTGCAGPGWFLPNPQTGRPWAYGRGSLADFYIGPESDDPVALSAEEIGITTEAEAAAVIVAQAIRRRPLTLAEARDARDAATGLR